MLAGTVTLTVTDAAGGDTTLSLCAGTVRVSVSVGLTVSVQLTTIAATATRRPADEIVRERSLGFMFSPADSGK